jgi:hypothetical protein
MTRNILIAVAALGLASVSTVTFAQSPADNFRASNQSTISGNYSSNGTDFFDANATPQRFYADTYGSSAYDRAEDALGSLGD